MGLERSGLRDWTSRKVFCKRGAGKSGARAVPELRDHVGSGLGPMIWAGLPKF